MNKIFIFLFTTFCYIQVSHSQNVFQSVQAGDWDDASTWFSSGGTGGTEGINYPSATDSVYILHDVDIVTANSSPNFLFEGYLNIAAGVKLQCEVGNSNDGFLLDNNGVMHVYGAFYTAAAGEVPATASPAAKEFTVQGNSTYLSFSGSELFVSDDWEIKENAVIYIEDNVCLRVDDDVNFDGTGWTMCGDGDISIGGDGAGSNVSFANGASASQICTGTSIIRNTTGTDCSSGTVITTGTGASGSAPTAVDDEISTTINTPVNIYVLTIGTADSDVSLDTLQILKTGNNAAIDDNSTSNGGILSINDNGTPTDFTDDYIVYTPPFGFEGDDTFQYVIEDEEGLTDTATVTVHVINCGNSYVDLIGVGANGSTTATLTFTDTTSIDSIRLDLIYKNGKPTFATFVSSAGETKSGVQSDAINIAGNDDGVYRTTISSASSVTVTHDNSTGVRSFLAYIYRSGKISSITSIADEQVVYLFQNSYSFTQDIPAGAGPRNIRIQMPISELNEDSRSALLEVQAGPVYGSLETFTQDLGNSLKIFTLILKNVPGDVTELDVTITSKTGGAGDSFVTAGIDFGIQCSGTAIEATPDYASTEENTAVTIDILNNDILGNGGIDTTTITNLGLLDPQNGTVTFNSSGQAIYTPDPGFTGVDYFQYEVCDTLKLCDITLVTVTVTCAGGKFAEVASDVGLDLGGNKDGGLTWADFNRDGLIDVIVNTNNGTNDTRIYFAEQTSGVITYTDVTTTNASGLLDNINERTVVAGDLNNDGYPDFIRCTYQNTGIEVWYNRGPGSSPAYSFGTDSQDENISITTFSTSNNSGDGFNVEGLALADWNQDGWLDIIVENDGDGIEILENDKDGTFSEVAHATSGFSAGTGGSGKGDYSTSIDYNNDGFVDFMARRSDEVDLYRFDSGTNQFVSVAIPNLLTNNSEKGAITFCDVDQDGDFDIIWAHQSDDNNTSIYLQASDGSFSFGTNLVNDGGIEECDCADIDNDGDNDIFLGDDAGTSYLYINSTPKGGALSFSQDNSCIDVDADAEGSEFVDYDQDGDMDLYINVNGAANQLWKNGQDDENYLIVEPRYDLGSGKYRSATGANVVLVENCTDTCMIKDVSGGRGHGSQKPYVVHFGLANGPDRSYKIITYFVDDNGVRDTIIKSVTPSSLEGQKLIVYNTDSDLDLCNDADSDGILNNEDIDDDNDGVLDNDEVCASYSGAILSQSGVTNSTNILGAPDNNFAEIHTNGDVITIDFGSIYPLGTEYLITWRRKVSGSGTWIPIIQESTDNATYYTHTASPSNTGSATLTQTIISQKAFRYIRITKDSPPSVTDFEIDAIGVSECSDLDGDGIPNSLDGDSDNDGIPDIVEAGGEDTDGDGVVDGTFTDGDGDGWSDVFDSDNSGTALPDSDTDGDGNKDRIDLDSDNDGIADLVEAGGEDFDGDGMLNGEDSDGDGLQNSVDSDTGGKALTDDDFDEDGFENRIDLDSDNDGIGDIVEAGGVDSDGNGIVDGTFTDTDEDGWSDTFDKNNGGTALTDPDTDEDGNSNRVDIDADDDGIIDIIESQPSGVLISPSGNDDDNDGIDDNFDSFTGSTLTSPVDTDEDGVPDYIDTDSDNDGDLDILEGWDTDNDGVADTTPNNLDTDEDGLDDAFDDLSKTVGNASTSNTTNNGQTSAFFPNLDRTDTDERDWREDMDNDNDGIVDAFDLDDDNDGIPDSEELNCTSGNADVVTTDVGVTNAFRALGTFDNLFAQVASGDQMTLDLTDLVPEGELVLLRLRRANINRILVEGSTDNSTFTNGVTYGSSLADNPMPNTGVFYYFYYQTGTGGARYIRFTREVGETYVDGVAYAPQCTALDTDGDGIDDQFDLDSDNDGIPDIVEAGGEDTDGNGKVDNINADGTLIADGLENGLADLYDPNDGGTAISFPDTDGDGIKDSRDLDADNDGIPDVVEAGGTDVNGDGRADNFVDTDEDGFNDVVDGVVGIFFFISLFCFAISSRA